MSLCLMEDEHGPVNVIVKPDVYQRDRSAVRMEPFLTVRGRLQKDGATLNVIAYEVEALRVPGTPVRRRGLSRSYASAGAGLHTAAGVGERPEAPSDDGPTTTSPSSNRPCPIPWSIGPTPIDPARARSATSPRSGRARPASRASAS